MRRKHHCCRLRRCAGVTCRMGNGPRMSVKQKVRKTTEAKELHYSFSFIEIMYHEKRALSRQEERIAASPEQAIFKNSLKTTFACSFLGFFMIHYLNKHRAKTSSLEKTTSWVQRDETRNMLYTLHLVYGSVML